jgi:hypothetical protein
MRTADLIGAPVLDHDGRLLGHVTDLRLVEDRMPDGLRSLRVTGLVLAPGETARLLAFDHEPVDRPRLLGLLSRRLAARARWIPWTDVALAAPGTLRRPGTVHLRPGVRPGPLHSERSH